MDRLLLESFPFRVLEGLCVACFAVSARQGILYVREEYPEARARIEKALAIWRRESLLPDLLDLRLFSGPGAFVCGEETALIASLEGLRGTPRHRPPYPDEIGLGGFPTLVNNVETLAAVPWILRHGAAAFRSLGTPSSPGTKTFSLAGKVRRGGLIEVPMGMTLGEIIDGIGGGVEREGGWKAVQIGGPSGGCVPAELAHLAVDYEALVGVGAFMGSGGLVVLDRADCMVDIARYFMEFSRRESCGKCAPCRIGTARMSELLSRMCQGEGSEADLAELEELAQRVAEGSLCNLGRSAPNPVLSTLRFFRHEYAEHLHRRCPARRCVRLIRYHIGELCIGCTRCSQSCPVRAIAFDPHRRHVIDESLCIRCGRCAQVCPVGAPEVLDR
jgi:NADH:ubiquinone oxidoreductase subunit F (NADH-binding)/NAD-dependent dihydropyrimidine dehydrogenase PreA subunit